MLYSDQDGRWLSLDGSALGFMPPTGRQVSLHFRGEAEDRRIAAVETVSTVPTLRIAAWVERAEERGERGVAPGWQCIASSVGSVLARSDARDQGQAVTIAQPLKVGPVEH